MTFLLNVIHFISHQSWSFFSFLFYVVADLWCIALYRVTVGIKFVLQSKCAVDLFKKKKDESNGI